VNFKFKSAAYNPQYLSQLYSFSTTSKEEEVDATKPKESKGLLKSLFGKESNVASPTFTNRWLMVIPAFTTQMCLGAPYAWSLMADVCTREIGIVAPAAADWTLLETAFPLSLVFIMHGLSASLLGKWQAEVGPRAAMGAASVAFGGGIMLGALGIHLHSIPLLYGGYGILGGLGIGLAYTPPIQTLISWFPDKKGMAGGIVVAGFGSGALFFAPTVQYIMKMFAKAPTYIGDGSTVTSIVDGKIFASVNGSLVEAVFAGTAELAKLPAGFSEGFYAVGTGSSGAAEALACMGAGYLGVILASSLAIKNPHPSYVPEGYVPPGAGAGSAVVVPNMETEAVMKTPQFYLLGTTFFCIASGGMGMLSVAKPLMSEVFSSLLPAVVTSAFASKFILMLSGGNLGGRLAWANISDTIGRRSTFYIFTATSLPIYLSIPTIVDSVVQTGATLPLYGFCAATVMAISIFGGTYAVLPAYQADLYGSKNIGAIHGRMLLFSSAAALIGPSLVIKLRGASHQTAIDDLLTKISPEKFQDAFGAPMEQASQLLATKTLTINKLMILAPPGTIDPTPHLYDTTFYTLGGLMATATIAHALVKPMHQAIKPAEEKPL